MQSASPAALVSKIVLVVDGPEQGARQAEALRALGAFVLGPVSSDAASAMIAGAGRIDVAVVDIDIAAPDVPTLVEQLGKQGIPTVLVSDKGAVAAEFVCDAAAVSGKPVDLGMVAAAVWLGPKATLR